MHHKFGFWTLTWLVVANMIGAGVFTTSGFTLGALGSSHLVMAAWAVGGLVALAGAVSYGMLIRHLPESGGEYLFLSRAAHPLLGFIAGWVSLIAGFSGAIAFAATAFEDYLLGSATPPTWLPSGSLAILAILFAGAVHGVRARVGAFAQNVVVLIKLGLLAGILLFALSKLQGDNWQGLPTSESGLSGWGLISAFAGALVWISLSYSGFNAAVYVAGEADQPSTVVPKALLTGTAIVFVLYLLLNAVFVYAPPADAIRDRPDVAAIAAQSLGGESFGRFVRLTIAACLLTSVFSMMMAAPRVYAKMAADGLMPAALQLKGDSPGASTLLQVAIAVGLVIATTLRGLLDYLSLTLSLCAASSAFCLLLPHVRQRALWHPMHWLPVIYIVATVVAAAIKSYNEPRELIGTVVTVGIGSVAFLLVRASTHSRE